MSENPDGDPPDPLSNRFPDEPPTPDELYEMMHAPRGASFAEIIAEFEAKIRDEEATS